MVNDPIGDMLAQIKNAAMARLRSVSIPYSKLKYEIALKLSDAGYIKEVSKTGNAPKEFLNFSISYKDRDPIITDLKRKSKPGLRVYVNRDSIPTVIGGMGICIVSTSKGIMTGREAKKIGLGGELLCEIW